MVLKKVGAALEWTELPDRQPGPSEIRVKVAACGVCRTDLHVVDGELPNPKVPITPGHEIVGRIDAIGPGVEGLSMGERVGVPWLGHTCGVCPYCVAHQENLCDRPLFTGYTRDGGFATATIADARYAFPLGEVGTDEALALLLCAGLIGWRSLVIALRGRCRQDGGAQLPARSSRSIDRTDTGKLVVGKGRKIRHQDFQGASTPTDRSSRGSVSAGRWRSCPRPSSGRDRNGCVNLSLAEAHWLFDWAPPRLPEGWSTID